MTRLRSSAHQMVAARPLLAFDRFNTPRDASPNLPIFSGRTMSVLITDAQGAMARAARSSSRRAIRPCGNLLCGRIIEAFYAQTLRRMSSAAEPSVKLPSPDGSRMGCSRSRMCFPEIESAATGLRWTMSRTHRTGTWGVSFCHHQAADRSMCRLPREQDASAR